MFRKIVSVLLSLVLTLTMLSGVASAKEVKEVDGFKGKVDVGGFSMYAEVYGESKHDTVTVVFDSGNGDSSSIWSSVAPEVAKVATQVITYDRIGVGNSDKPSGADYSAKGQSERLHSLLKELKVKGQIVLVSHSLAGQYARVFQAAYPEMVKGIVFVDSSFEYQFDTLLPEFPDEVRRAIVEDDLKRGGSEFVEGNYEDLMATFQQVEESTETGNIANLPIRVLSGGNHGYPPIFPDNRLEERWAAGQQKIANLSSESVYLTDQNNGHYLHTQNPAWVVQNIVEHLDVVNKSK